MKRRQGRGRWGLPDEERNKDNDHRACECVCSSPCRAQEPIVLTSSLRFHLESHISLSLSLSLSLPLSLASLISLASPR